MSTQGRLTDEPIQANHNFIKNRYDTFAEIPREGVFLGNNVDLHDPVLEHAENKHVVERVAEFKHNRQRVSVWSLTDQATELIEAYDPLRNKMPCGHHDGFTNERGTDYLQCNGCGGRFTAEEVRSQRETDTERDQ